jgi:hypothetical protein
MDVIQVLDRGHDQRRPGWLPGRAIHPQERRHAHEHNSGHHGATIASRLFGFLGIHSVMAGWVIWLQGSSARASSFGSLGGRADRLRLLLSWPS